MNQTPNMPVPPIVESKNRNWVPWVVACILGLAAIGAFTQKEQTPSAASTPASGNVGSTTPAVCVDYDGLTSSMEAGKQELLAATDSAETYDVSGVAMHFNNAANYTRDAAGYASGTPAISEPLLTAASLIDQAADSVLSADFDASGSYLDQATASIREATRGLNTGEAC